MEDGFDFGDGFLFSWALGVIHQDAEAGCEVMFGERNDLRARKVLFPIRPINEDEVKSLSSEGRFHILVGSG